MSSRRGSLVRGVVGSGVGLLALVLLSPGVGSQSASVGWLDAWRARLGSSLDGGALMSRNSQFDRNNDGALSGEEVENYRAFASRVGFTLRMPRALLALQVGATLALCGATFQTMFRNPLAEPYTLGIAGGGSLGALIAIRAGWRASWFGVSSVALAAFVGGMGVVGLVILMSRGARRLTGNEMVLGGVTLGLFCSAMMMVITVVSDQQQTFEMVRWMMGSLDAIGGVEGASLLPLVAPAWVLLIAHARMLNQFQLGDDIAASRGVHLANRQLLLVTVATLATAGVVAQCGPIGFVGLVVPHIAALMVGTDCRALLPVSAIVGASFLILCDWAGVAAMGIAGRVLDKPLASASLPIGVVTASLGVPIFLLLLKLRRREGVVAIQGRGEAGGGV